MRIVVFGGAGFVGSAVTRMLVADAGATVLVVDKLTASSSLASLAPIASSPRYSFRQADICDPARIAALLQAFAPDAIVHAAAGHPPALSATGTADAVDANFVGTWRLLEAVRDYWMSLPELRRAAFRVVGVSRAETESCPALASSAAAADVMLSWHKAYGLPAMVAKSAAAFGPYQFPSAEIPASVLAGIGGEKSGLEGPVRDWVYVDDLASALHAIIQKGIPGTSYTVSGRGRAAIASLEGRIAKLVRRHGDGKPQVFGLAEQTETLSAPSPAALPALDTSRLQHDTGWRAAETLDTGLSKTVRWYLANTAWWRPLTEAETAGDVYGLLRTA